MIKENHEIGRNSRDLAIIQTNIELPFDVKDTEYAGYDFQTINEFCQKYGLRQFINKVQPKWKKKDLASVGIEAQTVKSLDGFDVGNDIGIALDFADDNYTLSDIYGMAFSFGKNNIYISIDDLANDEKAKAVLADPNIRKFCYDYKAIKVALAKRGIEIKGVYFDLLIASYLIDSSLKNNPEIVMNIFGVNLGSDDEEVSLFTAEMPQKTAKMAYFCLNLKEKVYNELKKIEAVKLYETLEVPLIDTLADMEIEGFPLDSKKLDEFGDIYKEKEDALANEIYEMAGEKFNLA